VSTGPTKKTVQIVKDRAANHCERCGHNVEDRPAAVHHRRPRGMGGSRRPDTNSPCNLLLLCDPCHLTVESSRQISRERGWLVRQEHDPATRPVWLAGRGWSFLTPDGDVVPAERSAA
jgi:5-methylcytosine-specific restriction protein A